MEYPIDVSYDKDENSKFKRWKYTTYNFTMANFWAPHLVKSQEFDLNGTTNIGLYLDEFDKAWMNHVEEFDYIIISASHWFLRPLVFYENNQIVGSNYRLLENVTDLGIYYGYRKAFKTTFKAINRLKNYKGITYLRTFSPEHFENGLWNEGGNCVRTRPFRSNETLLEGRTLELYMTQVEEFRSAERDGRQRGLKFRLLDTTQAMLLRPDGHPNRYGNYNNMTSHNDCVHWCLPGPIDTWNDFLLATMKTE